MVVTSWQPLGAWFFLDSYVRFSICDYDDTRSTNTYAHLTNNSIAKHAAAFQSQEAKDASMWDTHTQLRAYLADNAAAKVMSHALLAADMLYDQYVGHAHAAARVFGGQCRGDGDVADV